MCICMGGKTSLLVNLCASNKAAHYGGGTIQCPRPRPIPRQGRANKPATSMLANGCAITMPSTRPGCERTLTRGLHSPASLLGCYGRCVHVDSQAVSPTMLKNAVENAPNRCTCRKLGELPVYQVCISEGRETQCANFLRGSIIVTSSGATRFALNNIPVAHNMSSEKKHKRNNTRILLLIGLAALPGVAPCARSKRRYVLYHTPVQGTNTHKEGKLES